jgi:hypothetical protein
MKSILLLSCVASVATVMCSSSASSAAEAGIGPSFKGLIGLQLYSLREQFPKDVLGTLDEVKSWGIKYAELAGTYGLSAGEFTKQLAARGIEPIGAHFDYGRYKKDPETVAREAKELGLKYAGCAWIPHQGDFDEKTCREAAAVFNKAGEVMAKHGLKPGRQFYKVPHDSRQTPGRDFGCSVIQTVGEGRWNGLKATISDPRG